LTSDDAAGPLAAPSWLLRLHEEISDDVDEADDDEFDMVELVLDADDEEDEVLRSKHWLMHEARAACGSTSCCCCWPALNLVGPPPVAVAMRCCWLMCWLRRLWPLWSWPKLWCWPSAADCR
jgi:hypothetical protein